jgi:hypothetical protein
VSYVAGIDPVLAVRLRLDSMRMNVKSLIEANPEIQVPSQIVDLIADVTDARELDETLLDLARLHSREVLRDVEFYFREEAAMEVPSKIRDALSKLIPRKA